MKNGDHGKRVLALQRKIMSLGIPLPRYGADGWFGDETYRGVVAVINNVIEASLPQLDVEFDETTSELNDMYVDIILDWKQPGIPDCVTDIRALHVPTACRKRPRLITDVTGIVLHQTAPGPAHYLGENPRRWFSLAAHVGVTADGAVIWVADFARKMWHANYFNSSTIGIEIDGHFEGVQGNRRTLWRGAPEQDEYALLVAQCDAARLAVRFCCEQTERQGGKIKYIYAHRQTSSSREADPGSAIWKQVGLWAQEELGLENDVNHTRGSGLPIPREWDPRSKHPYR